MKTLFSFVGAMVALGSFAETYYWKGADSFGKWTDPSNWSTEAADGEDAARLPGEEDTWARQARCSIDLDGSDAVIGYMDTTSSWDRHYLNLTNGSLKVAGHIYTHSLTLRLTDGAKVWYDCEYRSSQGHGAADEIFIADGCEWKMTGSLNNYKLETHIAAGGKAILDPTYFGIFWGSAQNSYFEIDGELDLPNGINWQSGANSSADNYFDFRLRPGGLLKLGGNLTRNESLTGRLLLSMSGGTLEVTEDAAFSGIETTVSGQTDINVAAGKTLNLGEVSYGDGVAVSKSGAGKMVFTATMPPALYLWGGAIKIAAPNLTFAGSVSSKDPVTVEIAEKGFTLAAEVYSAVNYRIDQEVFLIGDTILTCSTAANLEAAKASLAEVGINTTIEGTSLKLAASEIVFNSTTVTDLNDDSGWKSGSVPGEGVAVNVAGEGVKAIVSDTIPAFSGITVADGATLTIDLVDMVFPCPITLQDGGKLVVNKTATINGLSCSFTDYQEGAALNEITVPSGVELKVPGGTKFTDCNLTLNGSIVGTSDGKLIFGYAKADTIAHFAMTAIGATITAQNAVGNENGSRIEFVVPEAGGMVKVEAPILLQDTTITYNSKDGMAFGLNNPATEVFTITADGTALNVGAETVVGGGANLVLVDSRLLRKRHSEGDTGDSIYNIVVQNRGKITVGEGASIYAGVTRVNGDTTRGVIQLDPDETGFVGIEFLDGGTAHWYKANGLNKGAISFANATFEFTKSYWWGWGNRSHLFNGLTAVEIQEEKTLTFKCVEEKIYSSNADTYTYFIMEAPFTGAGNLAISNTRSSQTLQPTFVRDDNTCTGTLSVDNSNTLVHFANGANWAGTVVLNGKIDLIPADNDHQGYDAKPSMVTFGAVDLAADFTVRLWGKGDEGLRNDMINITGAGWSGEGTLLFDIRDGYDPQPTDKWLLGTAPADADMPKTTEKWQIKTEDFGGGLVQVYVSLAATSYNFVSNGDGSTDLNDPTAWECGGVPTGKEVTIIGEGVVAEINATQELPSFASIELKGGATLRINADLTETTLPTLIVDGSSRIEVEDGATVKLPLSLTTNYKEVTDGVTLAKILVKQGGTLILPAGLALRNADLEAYGTLKSEGAGILKFGTAGAGETSYFALKAEGAVFDITGRDDGGITEIHWLSPTVGGCVKAVGAISFKDTTFPIRSGWRGYYRQYFCANNPETEEVVFTYDNTILEASYETFISGSSRMFFTNGGYMTRSTSFAGHGGDININGNAVVTFEGENSGVSFNVSTTQGLRLDSSSTDNVRNAIVLKDGAYINVRRVFAANGAGIGVTGTGGNLMVDKDNGNPFALYNGATITIDEGAKARLMATKYGGTGNDWDRDVEFLGVLAGKGDFEIANCVAGKSFTVRLTNGSPAFEGTVSVAPADAEAPTDGSLQVYPSTLIYAPAADAAMDWSKACLVFTDAVSLNPAGGTHLIVGELSLAQNMTFRLNAENGDAIDVVGAGFTGAGALSIALPEDFDPASQTFYPLGKIAKGAALPKVSGGNWKVTTQPIADDEDNLVYGIRSASGFVILIQ